MVNKHVPSPQINPKRVPDRGEYLLVEQDYFSTLIEVDVIQSTMGAMILKYQETLLGMVFKSA